MCSYTSINTFAIALSLTYNVGCRTNNDVTAAVKNMIIFCTKGSSCRNEREELRVWNKIQRYQLVPDLGSNKIHINIFKMEAHIFN